MMMNKTYLVCFCYEEQMYNFFESALFNFSHPAFHAYMKILFVGDGLSETVSYFSLRKAC
jgi:hypothetical protein